MEIIGVEDGVTSIAQDGLGDVRRLTLVEGFAVLEEVALLDRVIVLDGLAKLLRVVFVDAACIIETIRFN